jgi:hypothetical protein
MFGNYSMGCMDDIQKEREYTQTIARRSFCHAYCFMARPHGYLIRLMVLLF